MNAAEYLLSSLGEEASEIAQLTSKANRFGLHDVYEGSDNVKKLVGEINDFFGVLIELQERGVLPPQIISDDLITKKRAKILSYMNYARERGRLTE